MRKYKEEYVGRTRLTQPLGSQLVTVQFPRDIWPGRDVRVAGTLGAATAYGIYWAAGNQAKDEDRKGSALADVNTRRGE